MNSIIRLKLEMAVRVRDFLRSHPLEGPGFTAAVTLFDTLLARATGHSTLQQEGVVTSRGATSRRRELKDLLRNGLLRHVAGVGLVASKERPELSSLFQLPSMNTHLSFVTAAGRILAEAEANKDYLVGKGLEDGTVDDLRKALTELESADVTSRAARANHVGARADLEAVARDIADQVKLLDGTVRYRFRDNPEVLAAWKSARNVAFRAQKPNTDIPAIPAPVPAPASPVVSDKAAA